MSGGGEHGFDHAARWWEVRRAQSFRPRSYTCPLCGEQLHAMTDHVLITPEGDIDRRRHAHPVCVRGARAAGRLLQKDEWEALQPRQARGGLGPTLGRLLGRGPGAPQPAEAEEG